MLLHLQYVPKSNGKEKTTQVSLLTVICNSSQCPLKLHYFSSSEF